VCADVGVGIFEPDPVGLWAAFTDEEVCTSAELASSRWIFLSPPGAEVFGRPLYRDDQVVLTDVTP
jgi:hypothetical protein